MKLDCALLARKHWSTICTFKGPGPLPVPLTLTLIKVPGKGHGSGNEPHKPIAAPCHAGSTEKSEQRRVEYMPYQGGPWQRPHGHGTMAAVAPCQMAGQDASSADSSTRALSHRNAPDARCSRLHGCRLPVADCRLQASGESSDRELQQDGLRGQPKLKLSRGLRATGCKVFQAALQPKQRRTWWGGRRTAAAAAATAAVAAAAAAEHHGAAPLFPHPFHLHSLIPSTSIPSSLPHVLHLGSHTRHRDHVLADKRGRLRQHRRCLLAQRPDVPDLIGLPQARRRWRAAGPLRRRQRRRWRRLLHRPRPRHERRKVGARQCRRRRPVGHDRKRRQAEADGLVECSGCAAAVAQPRAVVAKLRRELLALPLPRGLAVVRLPHVDALDDRVGNAARLDRHHARRRGVARARALAPILAGGLAFGHQAGGARSVAAAADWIAGGAVATRAGTPAGLE
eukprot:352455-Chlamydomonas_euryale.AAC.3